MKDEKNCDHCYCKRISSTGDGKADHKQCCNCGNKQQISDMEMNIKKF